ncbi:hypothetical protein AGDE_16661 [Angomonas deanei]|uniref:C3H1-type domain-containing protein n=1 Tax=Angomonas deanei TaxID=59799 RepID=A0A7G2C702_9TRYP|nr:hypothetical protein AGDE_16661 [Angomonas deanei]CAD2213732.1 hypothetical protein, conserved [Angomonas deanei]|eukprot:EPY16671.1 hypothetical protein AGDE_16661 [Angomonas deanei]
MLSIDVNATSLFDVHAKSFHTPESSLQCFSPEDPPTKVSTPHNNNNDHDDDETIQLLLMSTTELFTDSEEEADPAPPRPRIPREIEKLIRPAFLSARTRPSGKELGAPEYYYEKILKSHHINDDPHYVNYSYEKYQPYQFRVQRCPAYQPSEPASCRYGRNCFYAHGAGKQRTVEANLVGGLVSVKEVRWWLKQKNGGKP